MVMSINSFMELIMILLTMLLKYFLEKYEIRNRFDEKYITECVQQLDFKCGACADEFNTASGSET